MSRKSKIRPSFVKHIVTIMIVFGVVFIGFFGSLQAMTFSDLSVMLEVIVVVILAGLLISAFGLWTMKSWARKTAIVTMIAVILVGLPGLFALLIFVRSIRRLLMSEARVAYEK